MADAACRHCGKPGFTRCRGLCYACYKTPAVLALYPSRNPWRSRAEPTEAELDALIAERRKAVPAWWEEAERHQSYLEAAGFIPTLDRDPQDRYTNGRAVRPSDRPRWGRTALFPVRLMMSG